MLCLMLIRQTELVVIHADAGNQPGLHFSASATGEQLLQSWLQDHLGLVVRVVIDLPSEEYHRQSLSGVRRSEITRVATSMQNRVLPDADLACRLIQRPRRLAPRIGVKRADLSVLVIGVGEETAAKNWLNLFEKLGVLVESIAPIGLYILATVGSKLANRGVVLMVVAGPGSIRLMLLNNADLLVARVIAVNELNISEFGAQIDQTIDYAVREKLLESGTAINVLLANNLQQQAVHRIETNIADVGSSCDKYPALKAIHRCIATAQSRGALVNSFLRELLKVKSVSNWPAASSVYLRRYKRARFQQAAMVLSIVFALASLLSGFAGTKVLANISQLQQQAGHYRTAINNKYTDVLPAASVTNLAAMQAALKMADTLATYSVDAPLSNLDWLAGHLHSHRLIQLQSVQWRNGSNALTKDSVAKRVASKRHKNDVGDPAVLLVQAEVLVEAAEVARGANIYYEFVADLGQGSVVDELRPPFGLGDDPLKVQHNLTTDLHLDRTFTLQIVPGMP